MQLVVTAPLVFWLLLTATGSYAAGFVLSAAFSFAGAFVLLRRRPGPRCSSSGPLRCGQG
jgi:hypothetical protein